MSTLTPYAAAKVINAQLAADGIEKKLPPQMFYTYVNKGIIPSTDKKISEVDLMKWYVNYKKRMTEKAEQIQAQLQGE